MDFLCLPTVHYLSITTFDSTQFGTVALFTWDRYDYHDMPTFLHFLPGRLHYSHYLTVFSVWCATILLLDSSTNYHHGIKHACYYLPKTYHWDWLEGRKAFSFFGTFLLGTLDRLPSVPSVSLPMPTLPFPAGTDYSIGIRTGFPADGQTGTSLPVEGDGRTGQGHDDSLGRRNFPSSLPFLCLLYPYIQATHYLPGLGYLTTAETPFCYYSIFFPTTYTYLPPTYHLASLYYGTTFFPWGLDRKGQDFRLPTCALPHCTGPGTRQLAFPAGLVFPVLPACVFCLALHCMPTWPSTPHSCLPYFLAFYHHRRTRDFFCTGLCVPACHLPALLPTATFTAYLATTDLPAPPGTPA